MARGDSITLRVMGHRKALERRPGRSSLVVEEIRRMRPYPYPNPPLNPAVIHKAIA